VDGVHAKTNKNKKMGNIEKLRDIVFNILEIDHIACQCDDIHACNFKHQVILSLDKLNKHDVIRLLMHVIEVQQLSLANAEIKLDESNPFKDMDKFNYISSIIKTNSPDMETLY
jgi:hypothetical protein